MKTRMYFHSHKDWNVEIRKNGSDTALVKIEDNEDEVEISAYLNEEDFKDLVLDALEVREELRSE